MFRKNVLRYVLTKTRKEFFLKNLSYSHYNFKPMKPILPEARICMLTLGTKLLYWMFSEEKNDSIKTESNYQAMI